MSEQEPTKTFDITHLREKVRQTRSEDKTSSDTVDVDKLYQNNFSWQAISDVTIKEGEDKISLASLGRHQGSVYHAQHLAGAKYAGQTLKNADFSNADLQGADFKNANLEGADFSSADLTGADMSGANLNNVTFTGAILKGTNFTGAKMHGVKLKDADIEDAILLDVDMDEIALQELQDLVEFLATYYPHKLNLRRINLTLLDLSKIDLTQLDLRGVDFTGCNFTGVNIYELDLSECIISQAQIEQALGRPVTPKELKAILAPKNKKKKKRGIDLTDFFFAVGPAGVWNAKRHPGVRIEDIMRAGKKLYNMFLKRQDSDAEIMDKFHNRHLKTPEEIEKERHERMRQKLEEKKYEIRKEKEEKENEKREIEYRKHEYQKMQQKKIGGPVNTGKSPNVIISRQIIGREGR